MTGANASTTIAVTAASPSASATIAVTTAASSAAAAIAVTAAATRVGCPGCRVTGLLRILTAAAFVMMFVGSKSHWRRQK